MTSNSNSNNILDVLKDDLFADIFSFLGAKGTANCSEVCLLWYNVAKSSRCLWRQFCFEDFRLQDGDERADWKQVYAYVSRRLQCWQAREEFEGEIEGDPNSTILPLSARVVFSDDGSPVPGYPPQKAIRRGTGAWCTNAGVEEDVDLVLELPELCIITSFVAANGGIFYSAPLKEALVFTSTQPIDLEGTRKYNGKEGSKWAKKLRGVQNVNHNPHCAGGEPLLGFCFPSLPHAFGARLHYRLDQPILARYIHFKLLSSFNPPGMLSDNIDIEDLLTFGTRLPELPRLLKRPNLNDPVPKDPSYQRMHEIRDYPY